MPVAVRLLGDGDQGVLANAEAEVFDGPVDAKRAGAFLRDPRHHIAAAIDGERMVGFVSAVDYLHPDKPRALWINEVGVAPRLQRHGVGTRLMTAMLAHGRALGCAEAWVLTERSNPGGMALYRRLGGAEDGTGPVMFSFDLAAPPDA